MNSCPYRQAHLIQQALTPDKIRVSFILGAGCPMAIQVTVEDDKATTTPLIPDIAELTTRIAAGLSAEGTPNLKQVFEGLHVKLTANKPPKIKSITIEHILSHIRTLQDIIGDGEFDGMNKQTLTDLDLAICSAVTAQVGKRLPSSDSPYHRLASWVSGIPREHSVELFTTNYDLLMEQAFEEKQVPFFDGFVGSSRPFFDLTAIERDKLPSRWAKLWKIHGSINWFKSDEDVVERLLGTDSKAQQMIFPSHLKYSQSRRMPYLAMLDQLRNVILQGQNVVITCGYSFCDEHINDVILNALRGNANAACFALFYGDLDGYPDAVKAAKLCSNLTLIAADSGVINTQPVKWMPVTDKDDDPLTGTVMEVTKGGDDSIASVRCKLGDFAVFAEFLSQNLADRRRGVEAV